MISDLILEGLMKKNESFLPRHLIHPLLFNPLQILQPLRQSINVSLPILTEIHNVEAPGIFNLGRRTRVWWTAPSSLFVSAVQRTVEWVSPRVLMS